MSIKKKSWAIGLALAVVGVILTRLVARQVGTGEVRFIVYVVGIALALGGLAVILRGMGSKS